MQDEIEVGRLTIRRLVREDDVIVNIQKSPGLPYIDALGMAAFAQQFLGDIYDPEVEEGEE